MAMKSEELEHMQEQIEKLVDFTESFQIKMDQAQAERDKLREDFQYRATEKTLAMHLGDIADAL